jgi:hypothetical protein
MNDPTQALRDAPRRLDDPSGSGDLLSGGRVQLARVKDGLASIVLEAGGLAAEDRAALERKIAAPERCAGRQRPPALRCP